MVGFDRDINYYKIQYATLCIRENPGCMFIATNRDAVTHLTDAQEWAGAWLGGVGRGGVCGGWVCPGWLNKSSAVATPPPLSLYE